MARELGNITGEILRRMQPEATLVAIETNGEFYRVFALGCWVIRGCGCRPGFGAEVGRVREQLGCRQADCIIFRDSISTMPREVREGIIRATHLAMQPEGVFLVYQYSRKVLPSLKKIFGRVQRDFMMFNVLPIWLFALLEVTMCGEPRAAWTRGVVQFERWGGLPHCKQAHRNNVEGGGKIMKLELMQDFYVEEIQDLYSAEKTDPESPARNGQGGHRPRICGWRFEQHERETRAQKERLEQLFGKLGEADEGKEMQGNGRLDNGSGRSF